MVGRKSRCTIAFGLRVGGARLPLWHSRQAHDAHRRDVSLPWTGRDRAACRGGAGRSGVAARARSARSPRAWRDKLERVAIRVPPAAQPVVDTLRTSLAHILMTRDGPMLRPGTRSYARSWIRDGAMMAESLLRLGPRGRRRRLPALVRAAPVRQRQGSVLRRRARRRSGPRERQRRRVPLSRRRDCIATRGDRALLAALWPRRRGRRALSRRRCASRSATDANLTPARRAFYGPVAGVDQPRRLLGKADAFVLGRLLGAEGLRGRRATSPRRSDKPRRRREFGARSATSFARDLVASLRGRSARAPHRLPSRRRRARRLRSRRRRRSPSRPAGAPTLLPRQLLPPTFERYWREFVERRDGRKDWEDYTPYELRIVGTFVRLGWRERAHELLAFFLGRSASRGVEPVGRGRRARCARAALRRRHAARLGRVRLHPLGARPVRVRARRRTTRSCSRPASRRRGSTARASRSRDCARRTARSATRCGDDGKRVSVARRRRVRACRRAASSLAWPGDTAPGAATRQRQAGAVAGRRAAHPRASCRRSSIDAR